MLPVCLRNCKANLHTDHSQESKVLRFASNLYDALSVNIALLLTLFPTMKSLNDNFRMSISPPLPPLPLMECHHVSRFSNFFYDKTRSEEPLMLGLDKETELTTANV